MTNEKLISFDLRADFGFFKKPEHNDGILLSYNMLHKPALLGILGAVAGMEGYQQKGELPAYYRKLRDMLVGIQPLNHENGYFRKTTVRYSNTVGYANEDGPLLVEETMVIQPAYRCYLLLNMSNTDHKILHDQLASGNATFIPYMGKNEYQAWIDGNIIIYRHQPVQPAESYNITSLFIKSNAIQVPENISHGSFCYFEELPIGFNEELMQYKLANFAFTTWSLNPDQPIPGLYQLTSEEAEQQIIQLF
ncbi:CRISPR-associated protein Cas5 [Chitinophaga sp. HK235]|uniref:CRISPR-associated protein Cas5 n=1 Tax=Chitinophaga sp. HK235 TaxID=2952571 RepID=UPI001BA5140C|nr:CRISPR-associated protein Cas5 [Chitinophaga sp. HK235]